MVKDITPPAPSPRWRMNIIDWKKVGNNALIFSIPTIIGFLTVLQQGGTLKEAMTFAYTGALATLIDIFRKLKAGKGPTK